MAKRLLPRRKRRQQPAPVPPPEHWMNIEKLKATADAEMEAYESLPPAIQKALDTYGGYAWQAAALFYGRGISEAELIRVIKEG